MNRIIYIFIFFAATLCVCAQPQTLGEYRQAWAPISADQPTITLSTSASQISGGVSYFPIQSETARQILRFPFTDPIAAGTAYPKDGFQASYSPYNLPAATATGIEAVIDTDSFEVYCTNTDPPGSRYRLIVDGCPISYFDNQVSAGGASFAWLRFTFTTSRPRIIRFEIWNGLLGGFIIPSTAKISQSPLCAARPPRCVVIGDSITPGWGGWWQFIGEKFGWDMIAMGVGGTGYVNPGAYVAATQRIQLDIVRHSPDILILANGRNDGSYTSAQIQTAVEAIIDGARAGVPSIKIICLGSFCGSSDYSRYAPVSSGIAAAAASRKVPFVDQSTWLTSGVVPVIYSNTPAIGTATLSSGAVTAISVSSGGRYTSPYIPNTSEFMSVTGNGSGATATPIMDGRVGAINIMSGGIGYDGTTTITASGGGGSGFAATPIVVSGVITGVTITNEGTGYTSQPQLVVTGPAGASGAAISAVMSWVITGATVTNGGSGYSVANVVFPSPTDTVHPGINGHIFYAEKIAYGIVRAMSPTSMAQAISFDDIGDQLMTSPRVVLSAISSSGLAVSYTVVNGPATITGSTLTLLGEGTVTVRASQAGDANYAAAMPVDQSFTVAKAAQAITFEDLATKTYGDASFTVSATASSGLMPNFCIVSGPAIISGNTITLTGVGTVVVRAAQTGDANYLAATSVDQSFTVGKGNQSIIFDALPTKTYSATPFTIGATVSSGLTPTFSIVSGPATVSGNVITLTGLGTVVVRTSQNGDANYSAAADVDQSFAVTKGIQTITFDALSAKHYGDSPFALSATASSGLSPAYSIVSGPATVLGSTVTIEGVGTVVVRATQAGNTNYAAATPVDQSFTVSKGMATVTLGGLSHPYTGTACPVTATATPTGLTVTLTYNGGTTAPVNAGSYEVIGTISNSPLYQGSTSGTLVIGKAAQTITFVAPPDKTYSTTSFAVRATTSSKLAPVFSIVSGPAKINGNMITLTGGGTITVRASQDGNANYAAATPVDRSFTVSKITQAVTLASPAAVLTKVSPLTLTATASSKLPVTLSVVSGPATLGDDGKTLTLTGAGVVVVQATQTGNDIYFAAPALQKTIRVSKTSQGIDFKLPNTALMGASPFKLKATASSGLPVAFTVVSGPAILSDDGKTLTITEAGSVVVKATQAGNACYLPAAAVQKIIKVSRVTQELAFILPTTATINTSPLELTAVSSAGLPVSFAVVSGPAKIGPDAQSLVLTGVGIVRVRASQLGNINVKAALPVVRSIKIIAKTAAKSLASESSAALLGALAGNYEVLLIGAEASSAFGLPVGKLELNLDSSTGRYAAILALSDEAEPLFIFGTVEVEGTEDNPILTGFWSDLTCVGTTTVQFSISTDGVIVSVSKAGKIIAEIEVGVVAY